MLRKAGILMIAGALGAASAFGVSACGEERGDVQFEGDTGGTPTGGTSTGGHTETSGTETTGTETAGTATAGTATERTTTAK